MQAEGHQMGPLFDDSKDAFLLVGECRPKGSEWVHRSMNQRMRFLWRLESCIPIPVRAAIADWEKIVKVWSVVVEVAAVVAGVVAAARVEEAVVVVVIMAVVLVSPPTLYKPSATVLFHSKWLKNAL